MNDSAVMCDEDVEANSYDEINTIPTNFNEKKNPVKQKISIFYLHFY